MLSDCYNCDNCGKKGVSAEKKTILSTLPNVLCAVVKRFTWGTQAKIDTTVMMEEEDMKMKPFMEGGDGVYWLRSVVAHHGNTLRQGHYTNFSFNKEKG